MAIRPIIVDTSDLFSQVEKSRLKASVASGATTITVYSIAEFAVNKILMIGELGEEGTEIIKTHASSAPSGFTVTLVAAGLTKAHPKDTPVYIIPYDQVEVSNASTITGTKNVLSGTPKTINPENPEIRIEDTTYTSGYYFTRYKETIGNTFSDYSDPIPYSGYDSNMVGYIINNAMSELGKEFTEKLSFQTLLNKTNACLRFVRGKLKRWSNSQEFDYIVGQLNRGVNRIALPDTYYDKNSNKSMLAIRIGSGENLKYVDKREFNEMMRDVVHTQVATQQTSGGTTLVLDSTDDLPLTDGTVTVYVSGTPYEVSYTTNTRSTNTLSGIPASGTGSITTTLPVDSDVWYNESEDGVKYYSIWDGYIYFWGLIESENNGKNIIADFHTEVVEVDSETDIISDARYDMVEYWIKWEIKNIAERDGKRDMNDGDYIMFLMCLSDAVRRESSGQKFKMKPKINGIFYKEETSEDFERS